MVEDVEIRCKTSSITRSVKNLSSDMAEDTKVGSNGDDGNNETIERSSFKKSSGPMEYFTSLRSNANSAPFKKR